MIRVFADSFYDFALLNARDQSHSAAAVFARRDDVRYVTTAWVLTEVADGLSGDRHFEQAGFRALLIES